MQPARTRMSGVTLTVALLAILTPLAHAGARSGDGPGPVSRGAASAAARLIVPFGAPDGYVFTVQPAASAAMRAAGATPLMAATGIWRVSGSAGAGLAARLRSSGQLIAVDRNVRRQSRAADPLRAGQYAFGAINLPSTLPVPSRRILVIDTGLDVTHPDIAARAPGTTFLANPQSVTPVDGDGEWHGTAVVSTIGAAVDGTGGEGIYPAATIAMWDASMHPAGACAPGGCIDGAQVIAGLDWAIAKHFDIVSLSLGSPDFSYSEFLAVERAIAHGILVVAAAGNEAQVANGFEYPAAYDHVLSVAASDSAGAWSTFSNVVPTNDLAAPGVGVYAGIPQGFDITAGGGPTPPCDPLPGLAQPGWCQVDGTSFSTPITAAAAAVVWSARRGLTALQLADVLRGGARPGLGQKGAFDDHFGFGLLDVTRSLRLKAPPKDLREPNGDVPMVTGAGGFGKPQTAILRATQHKVHLAAAADYAKDPEDLYRVDVPGTAKRLKLFLRHGSRDLNVCVWRWTLRTVRLQDDASERALIGCSRQTRGHNDSLTVKLKRGTRRVFVDVYVPRTSAFAGSYTLAITRS